jgi:hypothetical protein
MTVVWEDLPEPSPGQRVGGFRRDSTPQAKEANDIREQLQSRPDTWARLFDFGEDKEAAQKKANYMGRKGYNYSIRETPGRGWSLYGRYTGVISERKPRQQVTESHQDQPNENVEVEPTFG